MLGTNYLPEFFNGIPGNVGDPLKRICEETLEDLRGFKETLEQFGVHVIQPELDPSERFMDDPKRYPRGPLQPRDHNLVLGNECYITNRDHPAIEKALDNYSKTVKVSSNFGLPYIDRTKYENMAGDDWPSYIDYLTNKDNPDFITDKEIIQELDALHTTLRLTSSNAMMVDDRVVVGGAYDPLYHDMPEDIMHLMFPETKHFDIVWTDIFGHTDGSFHAFKKGAIISLLDVVNYAETFPGWDVCFLPDQGNQHLPIREFKLLKKKNEGKWWVAGEENNDEFTEFVEKWLQDWVGYVEESVFDVNMLVLDEHHVAVSNPNNEQVNSFLKKHGVEPVYVPWRHRYFWDGGLHCITLDLKRK